MLNSRIWVVITIISCVLILASYVYSVLAQNQGEDGGAENMNVAEIGFKSRCVAPPRNSSGSSASEDA